MRVWGGVRVVMARRSRVGSVAGRISARGRCRDGGRSWFVRSVALCRSDIGSNVSIWWEEGGWKEGVRFGMGLVVFTMIYMLDD